MSPNKTQTKKPHQSMNYQLVIEPPQLLLGSPVQGLESECNVSYRVIKSRYQMFKSSNRTKDSKSVIISDAADQNQMRITKGKFADVIKGSFLYSKEKLQNLLRDDHNLGSERSNDLGPSLTSKGRTAINSLNTSPQKNHPEIVMNSGLMSLSRDSKTPLTKALQSRMSIDQDQINQALREQKRNSTVIRQRKSRFKIETDNVVQANKEHKDIILPILNKMRFFKTKIKDESLMSAHARENGDFQLIIEKEDLLNIGVKEGNLNVLDNPNVIMKKVHDLFGNKAVYERYKRNKGSEERRIEKQNFNQLQKCLNNNVIYIKGGEPSHEQSRHLATSRAQDKRSTVATSQIQRDLVSRLNGKRKSQSGQMHVADGSLSTKLSQNQIQAMKRTSAYFNAQITEFTDKPDPKMNKRLSQAQMNQMKHTDEDQDHHHDANVEIDTSQKQIRKILNQHEENFLSPQSSAVNLIASAESLNNPNAAKGSQYTTAMGFQFEMQPAKPDKFAALSIANDPDKKYVVNHMGKKLLESLLENQSPNRIEKSQIIKTHQRNNINGHSIPMSRTNNLKSTSSHMLSKSSVTKASKKSQSPFSQKGLISPKSQSSTEQIFAQTARKERFFNQLKQFEHIEQKEEVVTDPNITLLKSFNELHVLPMPVLVKLQKNILSLIGYQMSEGVAVSLGKSFTLMSDQNENAQVNKKHEVKEVYLENNNFKDSSLSMLLRGLLGHMNLKRLCYSKNEFGVLSLDPLLQILSRPKPNELHELEFHNIKTQGYCIEQILYQISQKPCLRVLKFSQINMSDSKLMNLIIIVLRNSSHLVDFELSWASVFPIQLEQISKEIESNNKIQSLNLSWNTLDPNNTHSLGFVTNLCTFIKYNKNLIHLDLTGMNLSVFFEVLLRSLRNSTSLLSVHLSNNDLNQQHRKKSIKLMGIIPSKNFDLDHEQTIDESFNNHRKSILNKDLATVRSSIEVDQEDKTADRINQQEAKIINTHVLKQIKAKKANHLGKISMPSQIEPQFLISRYIEHQELVWNMHLGCGYKSAKNPLNTSMFSSNYSHSWKVQSDCYVCQKWQYVVIFYKQSQSLAHFQQIGKDQAFFVEDQNQGLINNVDLSRPLIAGTFSNWQYVQLLKAYEFAMILDPKFKMAQLEQKDPFDVLKTLTQLDSSIKADYKARWRSRIMQYLRYQKHITFINLPKGEPEFDLQVGEDLFVFSGWMKPGRHKLIIKDLDYNCYFAKQFAVDVRQQPLEILQQMRQARVSQLVRHFKKEASVFRDWREDNQALIQKMFENDVACWKVPRFIKAPDDIQQCTNILFSNYDTIKKVFTYYASSSCYPAISMIDFSNICAKMSILDRNVTMSTLDRLFIATNVELVDMEDNPDKELCRFEMLEILVRIAGAKFKETNMVKTYADGLQMLLDNHFLPLAKTLSWQEFRDNELWCLDVNDILDANLENLRKVFNQFAKKNKTSLSIKEVVSICRSCNMTISEKDIIFNYAMSKMSVINESTQSKQYTRMLFVEFLEFIGRIAAQLYAEDTRPLALKIALVIDSLFSLLNLNTISKFQAYFKLLTHRFDQSLQNHLYKVWQFKQEEPQHSRIDCIRQ